MSDESNDQVEVSEPEVVAQEVQPRKRRTRRTNPRAEAEQKRAKGIQGERIPVGVQQLSLSLRDYGEQLPGFVPRWVNDEGNRIQDFLRGGWVPIYKDNIDVGEGDEYIVDQDTWVSEVVGSFESGRPKTAFAMKIKKEWYNADQAKKAAAIKEVDDMIMRRGINQPDGGNHYVKQANYSTNRKT